MFTGIIEHHGVVSALDRSANGGRIRVRAPELASGLAISGSIAVNGCCLTVVERDAKDFSADLSPETLRRTTFGDLKPGARVNLERPLTAGKELGGHFVQGHVDSVGRIVRLDREGGGEKTRAKEDIKTPEDANWWLEIQVPGSVKSYVAEKGSIAVDGISLTIAAVRGDIASFAIIPYTYAHTNLAGLHIGDPVNLEADILAKYVERLLEARRAAATSRLSVERLVEEGF
jgi:riboflavin synthase